MSKIYNLDVNDFPYAVDKIVVVKDGAIYCTGVDTVGDGRIILADFDTGKTPKNYEMAWDYAVFLHRLLEIEETGDEPDIHYENMDTYKQEPIDQ